MPRERCFAALLGALSVAVACIGAPASPAAALSVLIKGDSAIAGTLTVDLSEQQLREISTTGIFDGFSWSLETTGAYDLEIATTDEIVSLTHRGRLTVIEDVEIIGSIAFADVSTSFEFVGNAAPENTAECLTDFFGPNCLSATVSLRTPGGQKLFPLTAIQVIPEPTAVLVFAAGFVSVALMSRKPIGR